MFVEINNTLYTIELFLDLVRKTRKTASEERKCAMWKAGVAAGIGEQRLADAFCGM